MAQPLLFSLIDKAIYDYKMIVPGDRILLGAGGGKDSTALIEYFSQRSKRRSADFESYSDGGKRRPAHQVLRRQQ